MIFHIIVHLYGVSSDVQSKGQGLEFMVIGEKCC